MRFFENSCDPESMSKSGFCLLGFVESEKTTSRHLAVMSTRNLRFRHVAIWRDPFLGGWPLDSGTGYGVFWGGVGFF